MAQASNSTAGTIVLAGDLRGGGTANSVQLRPSGVTATTYPLAALFYVDKKGRVTNVSSSTFDEGTANAVGLATSSAKGLFKGKADSPFVFTSGTLSLPNASSGTKGVGIAGTGLSASGGTVSVDMTGIPDATSSVKGKFSIATDFTASGGVISHTTNPSGSVLGTYKVGSGLGSWNSYLTRTLAEGSSVSGLAYSGNTNNITITTGGAVNVGTNVAKLDAANAFTKAQVAAMYDVTYASSISLDLSQSTSFRLELTGNVTLTTPTNGVAGGVYTLNIVQDGTGSRTVSHSAFRGAYTASTAPGAIDVLTIIYTGSDYLILLNDRF